jgi:trk system potassium uptake protein TrkH
MTLILNKTNKNSKLLITLNGCAIFLALVCLVVEYGFQTTPLSNEFLHVFQIIAVVLLLTTKLYTCLTNKTVNWKHILPDAVLLLLLLLALWFLPSLLYATFPRRQIFWSIFHVYLLVLIVLRVARSTVAAAASGRAPTRVLFVSFALIIITGAILLMLPSAHTCPRVSFTDAIFTATSATCVTGLTVLDTGGDFTYLGQTLILFMIQIGGLGIMIFGTLFAILLGSPLSLRESVAMKDIMNEQSPGHIGRLVVFICLFTFVMETIGFLGLLGMWHESATGGRQVYKSMFHSISAYCNAGFALQPDSLISYRSCLPVYSIICPLIILGGLGFPVLHNLYGILVSHFKKWYRAKSAGRYVKTRSLTLHSKIVLITSAILLLTGWLLLTLLEHTRTDGSKVSWLIAARDALFQSVTARTAGFNTVDTSHLSAGSKLVLILLMSIGGSPSSTAGGVKTVTLAVMALAIYTTMRRREQVQAFHRTIPTMIVRRAATLITIYGLLLWFLTLLLTITEHSLGADLMDLLFEVASALGTVGLSTGVTGHLTCAGKWVIIIAMLVGRLGPLSLLTTLTFKYRNVRYEYPSEPLVVG